MNAACALIIRIITLLLLIYALALSAMTLNSCHFLSALTPTNEAHGVGLTSFELESGECLSHSTFIRRNYNGMEVLAKAGGYAAPCLGAVAVLMILLECCRGEEWFCGGKCFPLICLLGAVVCQGLTFFLFRSDLFCSQSETIEKCVMEEAAYRSVQATICYFVCFILYLCGGTPKPLLKSSSMAGMVGMKQQQEQQQGGDNANNTKQKKKTGEYTKEDYERRRKEKNISSRGVSGRSKKQIYQDIGDSKKVSSSERRRKKERPQSGRSASRSSSNHNNSSSSRALVRRDRSEERKYPNHSHSESRRGGEDNRDREYFYDEEEQHYRRNDDDYTDYSDGRGWDNHDDQSGSRYSDRSGYLGTVYDESRYSRENSRGSRHDSYRSGRSSRDRYDDGGYNDDYIEGEDTFGEPYNHEQDHRRGDEYDQYDGRGDDGYNDSYYSKHSHNDSASRYAERKYEDQSYDDGYDEASYNDASYADDRDYRDERRRDDDYYDGPPLT